MKNDKPEMCPICEPYECNPEYHSGNFSLKSLLAVLLMIIFLANFMAFISGMAKARARKNEPTTLRP